MEDSVAAAAKAARRAETAAAGLGPRVEALAGEGARQADELRRVRDLVPPRDPRARSPPRRAAHVWAFTRAEPPSPRRAHPRPPAPHRNGRVAAAPSRYASGRQSGPVGMAGRGGDSRRRAWGRRREARGEGRGRARETGRRHAVTRSWGGLEGRRRNPSAWEPRLDAAERGRGAWKEA